MRAGRDRRQETSADPDFRSYSAQARGFVYFYIDREDQPKNTLIKTDQIALEVYWGVGAERSGRHRQSARRRVRE